MNRVSTAGIASIVLGGIVCLAGCESPSARKALSERQEKLRRSAAVVAQMDKHRVDNLARTANIAERRYARDVDQSGRNLDLIQRWPSEEFHRWNELEPAYRRGIDHQIDGDPANIERTWPHMLY